MPTPYAVEHQGWCLWERHRACCDPHTAACEVCDCGAWEVQALLDDRAAQIHQQEAKLAAVRLVLERLTREAKYLAGAEGELCQYDRGRLDMRRLAIARLNRALREPTFRDATTRINRDLADPIMPAQVAAVRAAMDREDES